MNKVERSFLALEWVIMGQTLFEREIYCKIYVKKTMMNGKPVRFIHIFSINCYKVAKFENHTITLQTQSTVFMGTLYDSYINNNYIYKVEKLLQPLMSVFIYDSFNQSVSISKYIAVNGRMISQ
jgi:hypothetical protein